MHLCTLHLYIAFMSRRKNRESEGDKHFPKPIVVTDVLDLHGFFPEQVPEVVGEFIRHARKLKLKRLQIIHGKGRSRLKYLVRQELQKNPHVQEFGDAPPELGGWGRTVLLLKE